MKQKINNWRQKKKVLQKFQIIWNMHWFIFFKKCSNLKTPILPALLNSFHIWNYSLTISFFVLNRNIKAECTSIHGPPRFFPATHTHIHEKSSHSQPRAFSTHVFVPTIWEWCSVCVYLSLSKAITSSLIPFLKYWPNLSNSFRVPRHYWESQFPSA